MRSRRSTRIALILLIIFAPQVFAQPDVGLSIGQQATSSLATSAPTTAFSFDDVELPDELALGDVAELDRLGLATSLERAQRDNPTIKAARERLKAARGTYRSRTAANNPVLSFGATVVPRPSSAEDSAVSQFPDGAEVQRPLATVVIGGLITSTLLTLLVVPTVYHWFTPADAAAPPLDVPDAGGE